MGRWYTEESIAYKKVNFIYINIKIKYDFI